MTTLFGTAAAIAIGLGAALATAPRDGFETEIFIAAPPETVWSLLTDPVEHAAWNPTMRAVAGRFMAGERLRLEMLTPSGRAMTFRPRVLLADPGRELRWLGRLGMPRLFDGEHYFRLVPENGGTRLIHGERFRGLVLWVMDIHQFRPAFEAANEGLRKRAESLHPGYASADMPSPGAGAAIATTLTEGLPT
jgi:hypothetical protein